MNINYKDGKLQLDLHDLLDNIREEDLSEYLENISCNDKVIKHVTDQILDKWTENCYSGGAACTADAAPVWGLDKAWREVAKRSGEVAKREIERLEEALKRRNEEYFNLVNEYSRKNREGRYID
jgi:hypothetical protein